MIRNRCLVFLSRVLLLSGAACAVSCAGKPTKKVVLPTTGVAGELVRETPVIDVHTHTFNSRFLPIRNIALGKRDMHPLFQLVPDAMAIAITDLITRLTVESIRPTTQAARLALMNELAASANEAADRLEGTGKRKVHVTAAQLMNEPAISGLLKIEDGRGKELTRGELKRLEWVIAMFAEGPVPRFRRGMPPWRSLISLDA